MTPRKGKPSLSEPDTKALARLLGKYGRTAIAAAALDVPLPKRGRPTSSRHFFIRELAELAKWLDRRQEVHKKSTHRHAQAAISDFLKLSADEAPHGLGVFLKRSRKTQIGTIEKLWIEGRRIRAQRHAMLAPRKGRD